MKRFFSLVLLCLSISSCTYDESVVNTNSIDDIQDLSDLTISNESNYLLIYPSDVRTSQNYTLIKEIDNTGKEITTYKLEDESFKRFKIHEKPSDPSILYLSKFGDPILERSFYTYDLYNGKFEEHTIDNFQFDVGISHIKHFGNDIIFQTVVTHTTGDQQLNDQNDTFKVSIVNYSNNKGYETDYGFVPTSNPILQLGDMIYYTTSSMANEDASKSPGAIAQLNQVSSEIKYYYFIDDASRYISLFSNEISAYFISDKGDLIEIDNNLNYTVHPTFSIFSNNLDYGLSNSKLMLNKQTMIIELYDYDINEYYIGILSFDDDVSYMDLELDYIDKKYYYKFLYQDIVNKCIYMIEMNEDEPYLLVISNSTFELLDKIRVEYPHLLDMVIKNSVHK